MGSKPWLSVGTQGLLLALVEIAVLAGITALSLHLLGAK